MSYIKMLRLAKEAVQLAMDSCYETITVQRGRRRIKLQLSTDSCQGQDLGRALVETHVGLSVIEPIVKAFEDTDQAVRLVVDKAYVEQLIEKTDGDPETMRGRKVLSQEIVDDMNEKLDARALAIMAIEAGDPSVRNAVNRYKNDLISARVTKIFEIIDE